MTALICGSYAFDTIMVFPDHFKNHILPDKLHMLNVSFMVPEMRREFGGCAGNIAYNLNLIGGKALPMATVGQDFGPYADWMVKCGIDSSCIKTIADSYTAQAFITTDLDDNQITAFHPGSMSHSHLNSVSDAQDTSTKNVSIGIVSPDGFEGMVAHAEEFSVANIPFIFDPGQGLPMFDSEMLLSIIDKATWLTVNDYEMQMVLERTGLTEREIAAKVDALIVTKGGSGSVIYEDGREIHIPSAKPKDILDPTGCGDAYRAGLLYGLMNDLGWDKTGRIASLLGAIKIEHHGTQNHSFTMDDFSQRYEENFGQAF